MNARACRKNTSDQIDDADLWQSRALCMLRSVGLSLSRMKACGVIPESHELADYLSLEAVVNLSHGRDKSGNRLDLGAASPNLLYPVRSYLNEWLPGYDEQKAMAGERQPQTAQDQHGFLVARSTEAAIIECASENCRG